jgi:SAM-dependent methyltransferase
MTTGGTHRGKGALGIAAVPRRYTKAEVLRIYSRHPLQGPDIVRRVRSFTKCARALTEVDLAVDERTQLTDQNHIGGIGFVEALAQRATVTSASRILDLGCGLGGSARVLASRFGCRVTGLDLSPVRIRAAERLTRLVGLERLVRFRRADFMTAPVRRRTYDVLWSQSAWVHVADKERFVRRWARALRDGGRIAIEDVYVKTGPRTSGERAKLARVADQWKAYLTSLDEWRRVLTGSGCAVLVDEDLSDAMKDHFSALIHAADTHGVVDEERRAWCDALALSRGGILGYRRLVASPQAVGRG